MWIDRKKSWPKLGSNLYMSHHTPQMYMSDVTSMDIQVYIIMTLYQFDILIYLLKTLAVISSFTFGCSLVWHDILFCILVFPFMSYPTSSLMGRYIRSRGILSGFAFLWYHFQWTTGFFLQNLYCHILFTFICCCKKFLIWYLYL